ncbi:MAG: Flp family type IVb pilin [Anaerolineae bacterium]
MLKAYLFVKAYVDALVNREEGQDLAEYALLLVFIALVVIVALTPVGTAIKQAFTDIQVELVKRPGA